MASMPPVEWPIDRRLVDAERGEQRLRVAGELLEGELIARRLARFAEADLVGRDDAIARFAQHPDAAFPGRAAEILAVQQHDRPARRAAGATSI